MSKLDDKVQELKDLEKEASKLVKEKELDAQMNIEGAKDAIDAEVKKIVKELARVKTETSAALDSLKDLTPEEREAKAKEIVQKAVSKMENISKQVETSVLGEDKKFDATDVKRLANDGIKLGAKALGEFAKGVNWLKEQIEKVEIK